MSECLDTRSSTTRARVSASVISGGCEQRFQRVSWKVSILHTGSAQIGGGMRERGFSVNRLRTLAASFAGVGCNAELAMISDALPEELRTDNEEWRGNEARKRWCSRCIVA